MSSKLRDPTQDWDLGVGVGDEPTGAPGLFHSLRSLPAGHSPGRLLPGGLTAHVSAQDPRARAWSGAAAGAGAADLAGGTAGGGRGPAGRLAGCGELAAVTDQNYPYVLPM